MTLVTFYLNQSPDHAGRRISDICAFSRDQLEYTHDFIQWLFPLEVTSPVNPEAPTLDAETVAHFRTDPGLRQNLLRSLDLMLDFYGLQRTAEPEITPATSFAARSASWLRPGNHNHLRLTRILHCLTLCGLGPEAAALLDCLLDVARDHPRSISATTLKFWRNAVRT